jgi:integrase
MGRPSKPWWNEAKGAWYSTIGGELCRLAAGRENRREAEGEFHRLKALAASGKARGRSITAYELCLRFLARCERELAPASYETYRNHLRAFDRHFGRSVTVAELRPHHIAEWVGSKAWADTTRADHAAAIKSATRWGLRQGYVEADPLAMLKVTGRARRERVMTDEQAARVVAAAGDGCFGDLLRVLRDTGARPSEAMRLEASMIDFGRGVAVMASKTTRRTGRPRVIVLGGAAADTCRRLAALHPEGPILRNRSGRPWTRAAMASRFASLRAKLGLGKEATAESFRHQFATDALQAEVPIATVAQLMGHASTTMIERTYSHLHDRVEYLHESLARVRPTPVGSEDQGNPTTL